MSSKDPLTNVLTNPDELDRSVYFSKHSFSPEMTRQIQVLVEEGYLKCTPLLTLLCKVMKDKCSTGKSASLSDDTYYSTSCDNESSGKEIYTKHHASRCDISSCSSYCKDISPGDEKFSKDGTLVVNQFELSEKHTTQLHELARLIEELGIHGRERPIYIAKRLFFDANFKVQDLQHDLDLLQSKVVGIQYCGKNKKRGRAKRGRRGGKKNRKVVGRK